MSGYGGKKEVRGWAEELGRPGRKEGLERGKTAKKFLCIKPHYTWSHREGDCGARNPKPREALFFHKPGNGLSFSPERSELGSVGQTHYDETGTLGTAIAISQNLQGVSLPCL